MRDLLERILDFEGQFIKDVAATIAKIEESGDRYARGACMIAENYAQDSPHVLMSDVLNKFIPYVQKHAYGNAVQGMFESVVKGYAGGVFFGLFLSPEYFMMSNMAGVLFGLSRAHVIALANRQYCLFLNDKTGKQLHSLLLRQATLLAKRFVKNN